jgi:hypothetical protein
MKESIRAINFLLQSDGSMHGKRVGVYNAVDRQYTADPNRTIIWPGGTTSVPVDNWLVAAGAAEFNTAWILVGAGSAAVVLVGGLLLFVRKRYRRLQHVLIMLVTEMAQLVWSISIETADLATDCIACFRVLQSDTLGEGYKVAYAVFLCLGILTNVASVAYRLRNALLVRMHVAKLAAERDAPVGGSERQRQVQSYQWELKQSHRALVVCGLTLMTVAFQGISHDSSRMAVRPRSLVALLWLSGAPMATISCLLVFVDGVRDPMVRSHCGVPCDCAPGARGSQARTWRPVRYLLSSVARLLAASLLPDR